MEAYFIVYLTNGFSLSFNKCCSRVEYNSCTLCRFVHDGADGGTTLALIPYDKILYIERKEEII